MNQAIFVYTDYRRFLKERLAELKRRYPRYSHRYVIQKVGVSSSGWLSDILSGRKSLSTAHRHSLAEVLQLDNREKAYFELLVEYGNAASLREKEELYLKMLSFQEVPAEIIGRDSFAYFEKWYHSAIRELLLNYEFSGDYNALAQMLMPAITPSQAEESITLLLKLGLAKKHAGGIIRPAQEHVRKKSDFNRVHYYRFLQNAMALGMEAPERFEKEERDISALVANLNEKDFRVISQEIKNLRRKIIDLSESSKENSGQERVYQCIFQIFPLSEESEV